MLSCLLVQNTELWVDYYNQDECFVLLNDFDWSCELWNHLLSNLLFKSTKKGSLFQNNVMPNGEANITNNVLEMMHADRHTVGNYRCTADNRVGQPDSREIYVNVLCK